MHRLERKYSVAALSWGAVGKSAIIHRFVMNAFIDLWDPTIEDVYLTSMDIDGTEVRLEILDTNGHEQYVALFDIWVRSCQGFLLVYDIGRKGSFEEIERIYQKILSIKDSVIEPAVLIGNCCDREESRAVSKEDGYQLAEKLKIPFFETSALNGTNITEAFTQLIFTMASSTGPAIRRYKKELKTTSSWNLKKKMGLFKKIKELEFAQLNIEKEKKMLEQRQIFRAGIRVRSSNLLLDIGKLFHSPQFFDLHFAIPQSNIKTPLQKRKSFLSKEGSILFRNSSKSYDELMEYFSTVESFETISCHKTIIALRCPKLIKKNKQNHRWNEQLQREEYVLSNFEDIGTFKNLLQFAYSGGVIVNSHEEIFNLRQMANYYQFKDLIDSCDKLLETFQSFDEVVPQGNTEIDTLETEFRIQTGLESYFHDFRQLLMDSSFQKFSDVSFKIENRIFYAHKIILISRSYFFECLLKYDHQPIHNFDFLSPLAFQFVLEFLYTGTIDHLSTQDAIKLLSAADYFNLEELIEICEKSIESWLSETTELSIIMELLQDSFTFNAFQLQDACISKLSSHILQIQNSKQFENLPNELRTRILERTNFVKK